MKNVFQAEEKHRGTLGVRQPHKGDGRGERRPEAYLRQDLGHRRRLTRAHYDVCKHLEPSRNQKHTRSTLKKIYKNTSN